MCVLFYPQTGAPTASRAPPLKLVSSSGFKYFQRLTLLGTSTEILPDMTVEYRQLGKFAIWLMTNSSFLPFLSRCYSTAIRFALRNK